MLKIFSDMNHLDLDLLAKVYGYDTLQERSFVDYLQDVFFRTMGAVYCVWVEDGQYVSVLRLEPYEDGMVLAGLHTAQSQRSKGYATELIHQAMQWLGEGKVFAHIHHRNRASITVHRRCGFRKVSDTARLLDGSVSASIGTYLLEI